LIRHVNRQQLSWRAVDAAAIKSTADRLCAARRVRWWTRFGRRWPPSRLRLSTAAKWLPVL